MLQEFMKFVMKGNMVELAIGFTVGASFSTVAKSLVEDIIMPPIGFVLGNADFSNMFLVLQEGESSGPYYTLEAAKKAGAITLNYGTFVNNVLSLLVVALAMFVIIKLMSRMEVRLEKVAQKIKK